MVSITEVLDAICEDKSLKLFSVIATEGGNSHDLLVQLKLSRKEYYSRMSRLMKTGIVKRKNGRHFLTAFGNVVYEAQGIITKAVENNYKLKAIDSINSSDDILAIDRKNLVDSLIDDIHIKAILLQGHF
jgi:hypothetical protein